MFFSRVSTVLLLLATVLVLQLSQPAVGQRKRGEPRKGQYKRIHQDALALILDDKHAKAISNLNTFLKDSPEDAESYYMLAFAYAQSDQNQLAV